jgi:hypothetical protein
MVEPKSSAQRVDAMQNTRNNMRRWKASQPRFSCCQVRDGQHYKDTTYVVKIYGHIDKEMTKQRLHMTNAVLCLINLFY